MAALRAHPFVIEQKWSLNWRNRDHICLITERGRAGSPNTEAGSPNGGAGSPRPRRALSWAVFARGQLGASWMLPALLRHDGKVSTASSDLTWREKALSPRTGRHRSTEKANAYPPQAAAPWGTAELSDLRDDLMAQFLRVAAGDGVPDLRVAFCPRWWDGATWSACLELEWHGTRWRVICDNNELVSLPWRTGQARRVLRHRRRPAPSAPLAPLLTGGQCATPALAAVQVLAPDDVDRAAALDRASVRRLVAGPDPQANPRQGILVFEAKAEEPAMAPPLRLEPDRGGPPVVVEQDGDWSACRHPACGGMRLLPAPGSALAPEEVCPSCQRR